MTIAIVVVIVGIAAAVAAVSSLHKIGPSQVGLVTKNIGRKLPAGSLIATHGEAGYQPLGLFDPTQPNFAAWRFRDNGEKRPLHRVLRVRTASPAAGDVHVIADTWTGPVRADRWRSAAIEPMSAAFIGTQLARSPELLPEITLHAPLAIAFDTGGPVSVSPQIIGYVRTLDKRLLLDVPD